MEVAFPLLQVNFLDVCFVRCDDVSGPHGHEVVVPRADAEGALEGQGVGLTGGDDGEEALELHFCCYTHDYFFR